METVRCDRAKGVIAAGNFVTRWWFSSSLVEFGHSKVRGQIASAGAAISRDSIHHADRALRRRMRIMWAVRATKQQPRTARAARLAAMKLEPRARQVRAEPPERPPWVPSHSVDAS